MLFADVISLSDGDSDFDLPTKSKPAAAKPAATKPRAAAAKKPTKAQETKKRKLMAKDKREAAPYEPDSSQT